MTFYTNLFCEMHDDENLRVLNALKIHRNSFIIPFQILCGLNQASDKMKVHWGQGMPHPIFGGFRTKMIDMEHDWKNFDLFKRTIWLIAGRLYNRVEGESIELCTDLILLCGDLDAIKRCLQLKLISLETMSQLHLDYVIHIRPEIRGLNLDVQHFLEKKLGSMNK